MKSPIEKLHDYLFGGPSIPKIIKAHVIGAAFFILSVYLGVCFVRLEIFDLFQDTDFAFKCRVVIVLIPVFACVSAWSEAREG